MQVVDTLILALSLFNFENTYDARMPGDFAVPTLFNGNFDAVFNPTGLNRTVFSDAIPGWSLHNGETPGSLSTSALVDVNQLSATDAPALRAELDRIGVDKTQPNYALKLESGKTKLSPILIVYLGRAFWPTPLII